MLIGAHAILYSKDSDADRAFLRDVIGLSHVDVGGGWLIFGLPPSEVAVHPGERNDVHELYLMCDDVLAFRERMREQGLTTTEVEAQGWGLLTTLTLPSGASLGVYQPRHASPKPTPPRSAKKKSAARPAAKKATAEPAAKRPVAKAAANKPVAKAAAKKRR